MSMAARLTSLIFQQYSIGFRVELKNISVDESVQGSRKEEVDPLTAIETVTITMGR